MAKAKKVAPNKRGSPGKTVFKALRGLPNLRLRLDKFGIWQSLASNTQKIQENHKKKLLKQLPRVKYEKKEGKGSNFLDKMSLARALLALAEIDHDHEYELCKAVAGQILEIVPEPDDIDLEED